MTYLNWYRLRVPHDNYTPRDLGKVFQAEGTPRMAVLESWGWVEQVTELGSEVAAVPARNTEPPRGTTRPTRRRRGTAEAGSGEGAPVSDGTGDQARAQDGPADGDGGEETGSDTEA